MAARAQNQKVQVQAEVVLASNKGSEVEPPELAKMKEQFQKQNFNFTSFKRLSLQVLEVSAKKPTELKLPNGTNASLAAVGHKDGIATVRVDIPRQPRGRGAGAPGRRLPEGRQVRGRRAHPRPSPPAGSRRGLKGIRAREIGLSTGAETSRPGLGASSSPSGRRVRGVASAASAIGGGSRTGRHRLDGRSRSRWCAAPEHQIEGP